MANKGLIGVQMSTIAPAKMPHFDAYESMGKLADIGYHCVEISQVPMTAENVAGFRKAIDELGLNVSSCTASTSPMLPGMPGEFLCNPDDYKKIVEDCRKLDCDMLRIGMLPMTCMGNYQKAVDFAKEANEYALKLKEDGIELDSHWIHRGGQDPGKFIKKYAGSIRLVHLKDYRIGEMPIPEGGVDFTSKEGMMKFMSNFTNIVQFAEVGEGTLDMPAIIQAGLEGGGEYFLVEQDDCYGRDPFDSLKISHDNLVKMGFGDWF